MSDMSVREFYEQVHDACRHALRVINKDQNARRQEFYDDAINGAKLIAGIIPLSVVFRGLEYIGRKLRKDHFLEEIEIKTKLRVLDLELGMRSTKASTLMIASEFVESIDRQHHTDGSHAWSLLDFAEWAHRRSFLNLEHLFRQSLETSTPTTAIKSGRLPIPTA